MKVVRDFSRQNHCLFGTGSLRRKTPFVKIERSLSAHIVPTKVADYFAFL